MFKNLILLLVSTVVLVACNSYQPNYYNGNYYMAGDSNCVRYNSINSNQIGCYNKKGEYMGTRNAMSQNDMQMYMQMREQKSRDINELNESISQIGKSWTPAPINYQNNYSTPSPQINQPKRNNNVNCYSTSSGYTYCR